MSRHPPLSHPTAVGEVLATGPDPWMDSDSIAVFTRRAPVPKRLNELDMAPWLSPPTDAKAWGLIAEECGLVESEFVGHSDLTPAAGVVIVELDGRIWVHSPVAATAGPFSIFPASICRDGETMQAAAMRAALDATGLKVHLERVLGDFARTKAHTRYYLARRSGGTPVRHGHSTVSVSLVPLYRLPDVLPGAVNARIINALAEVVSPGNSTGH